MTFALTNMTKEGFGRILGNTSVKEGVLKGINMATRRDYHLWHGSSTLNAKVGDVIETTKELYGGRDDSQGREVAALHAPPNLSSASGCSDSSGNGEEMCSGGSCGSAKVYRLEVLNPGLAKELQAKNPSIVKIPAGEKLGVVQADELNKEEKITSAMTTVKAWTCGLTGLAAISEVFNALSSS